MPIRGITPILNVSSVPKSLEWFESLGWHRGFTWGDDGMIPGAASTDAKGDAHFGSVCAGDEKSESQIFLCCSGQGSRGTIMPRWPGDDQTDGVWMSWWIDSIESLDALHVKAVELGYIVTMPPTDEPWGVREFHLRHPDGHMFRVSSFRPSGK
ncbi:MAG: VOC family protein [Planctomycetes bacterium]|nr:VOC family protein [Planctomycetota bacterium]